MSAAQSLNLISKGEKPMAKSINRVTLLGNLGSDPDVEKLDDDAKRAVLNVATNFKVKNKKDEWEERTEWHRVVAWDKQAELAEKYLKKGDRVFLEGRLRTRSWEDKNGEKRYITEVHVKDIIFLNQPVKEEDE